MGYSDTTEDEERRETRQGQEPVENITATTFVQIDEGQTSEQKLEEGDDKRTALLVYICEDLGSHSYNQSLMLNRESSL